MGMAARLAHLAHLVVKGAPLALEHMLAGDDDIDLVGAGFHRIADFSEANGERRQPGGKAGGDRGDGNGGALKRLDGMRHHGRVDADRARRQAHVGDAERFDNARGKRLARLGAQAPHAALGVVAGERGQVDAADRIDQPGGLVGLLDRAAPGQRRGAAFGRRPVDGMALEHVRGQRDAPVARPVVVGGRRFGAVRRGRHVFERVHSRPFRKSRKRFSSTAAMMMMPVAVIW